MFNKIIKFLIFFIIFSSFRQERCNAMAKAEQVPLIVLIELPPEIINHILDELNYETLCKISVVCKTFAAHVKEIKKHRQLGTIEGGTLVLRDQTIDLPLSDRLFFNQSLPIAIEGIVTIKYVNDHKHWFLRWAEQNPWLSRWVDKQDHCFSLKIPCVIRSNATLRITDGTILEFAPRDNRREPLVIEAGSGGLVVSNATLKTRTGNPEGVFLNSTPITFDGACKLDASGGMLIFNIEGFSIQLNSSATVVDGQVKMV